MLDKLKQLSKDTAVYGISTMLGRFLNFVLVPLYTNIFLPADYGIVQIIFAYLGILNIVYIYGMDSAYLKFASFLDIGDEKDNFSTPYISVFAVSVVFSLLIILLKNSILSPLSIPPKFDYLIYIGAFILMLDALAVIPFLKLRLERKAKKFALFKTINIVVNISSNIILIFILHWGIEAVFVSNLIASLVALLLLLPTIVSSFKFEFHSELFKRLIKFGLPYLPAGFAVMLVQVVDVPIMEKLTDFKTVGIYKANYKLGIFMMLFVNMFQYAWQPFFLQNAKEKNAREMFSKVLTYFTIIGSFILIVLSLFISDLAKINIFGFSLIGLKYWSGLSIVPVVLLAYLFNGMYVIFSAGIYIEEKSLYVPVVSGLGAFVNIVTNFLLIPVMGIMGAALATLAAYLIMALGYYFVTQKFYKINYEVGKILKIFLFIAVVGAIYYSLNYSGQLNMIYKFVLIIAFTLSMYLFAFDKKEIAFVKNKLSEKRNKI